MDISTEILTEIERDKIIQFCQDPILFNAVQKYVLECVYKHGIIEAGKEYKSNMNYALQLAWPASDGSGMPRSDEELGQDLRALTKATQLVGSGFLKMSEMQKPEIVKAETINPSE
jgi:hypothetical protein